MQNLSSGKMSEMFAGEAKRQEKNSVFHVLEAKWNKKNKEKKNTQCFMEEGYMDGASAAVD